MAVFVLAERLAGRYWSGNSSASIMSIKHKIVYITTAADKRLKIKLIIFIKVNPPKTVYSVQTSFTKEISFSFAMVSGAELPIRYPQKFEMWRNRSVTREHYNRILALTNYCVINLA